MEIKLTKTMDNSLEVKASGKIDLDSAVEFGTKITDSVEDNEITNLILDFSEIAYISSIGLRVILELHQKMDKLGSMKIKNVKPEVLNIFKMTGFDKFLTIE